MTNKKQTKKTSAEKKADLDLGKALFQKRDSLTPGSPESLKASHVILEWVFDVKD